MKQNKQAEEERVLGIFQFCSLPSSRLSCFYQGPCSGEGLVLNIRARAAPSPLKGPRCGSHRVAVRRGDAFPRCSSARGVTLTFLRTWARIETDR